MVFKTQTLLACLFVGGLGISDSQCCAMQEKPATGLADLAAIREARYREHLLAEFRKAENNGDIEWLQAHREQLIKIDPSLARRIDSTVAEFSEAINLSQASSTASQPQAQNNDIPTEVDAEEQRQIDAVYYEAAERDIRDARTEQEAAAILAGLYKNLTANHGENYKKYYDLLDQLPYKNLTELNAELNGLKAVPEINALIGDQIGMFIGHMLYRVWENPSRITADTALAAIQQALDNNDLNAAINLYKDYLSKSVHNKAVLKLIMNHLYEAINLHHADTIFDLFYHFLKNSSQSDKALITLAQNIKNGLVPVEKWGVIALCFVGTPYADEILPMVAKQLKIDEALFNEQLINQYEEYRTAIINGDADSVIKLGPNFVEIKIIDQETFNIVVESLLASR